MKIEPGKFCPLIKKDCIGLQCSWFSLLRGTHPQTGKEIDEWGCAVTWLPVLLIENAKETRQHAAATESFRNELIARVDERRQQIDHVPAIGGILNARNNHS